MARAKVAVTPKPKEVLVSALASFTDKVHACLAANDCPHSCADSVAVHLRELLKRPDFLAERYRRSADNEPKANLVYVSPQGAFSVVAFVWQAGQRTCIHDHVCWCVVGVLEGAEEETSFALKQNEAGERWLEPRYTQRVKPGHVCKLVPPDEDIHQVKNVGKNTAISIHVYGTDIGKRGTSINRRFSDLPVYSANVYSAKPGSPVKWREEGVGEDVGASLG